MLLDKIQITSNYEEVFKMLHVEHLINAHKKLQLKKNTIFYFISDEELLQINIDTLNHDYYTDIITFDYEDDSDIDSNEILISWERIQDNAKTYQTSLMNELYRVCFHGLLHLAGYRDKSNNEQKEMRQQEDILLNLYCST